MTTNAFSINNSIDLKTQASAPAVPLINNVYSDGEVLQNYRGAAYAAIGRANDFGGNFAFKWADCESFLAATSHYETRTGPTDATARTAVKWAYLTAAVAPAVGGTVLNGAQSVQCNIGAANTFLESPLFQVPAGYAGKAINVSFLLSTSTLTATTDYTVQIMRYNSSRVYQETLTCQGANFLGLDTWNGFFLSNSDATMYYSIMVLKANNATAGTIIVDSFYVGMKQMPVGMAGTDWVNYTPASSWVDANHTHEGQVKYDGDSAWFKGKMSFTGAPTSAALTISLAQLTNGLGISLDTTNDLLLKSSDSALYEVGRWSIMDVGTKTYYGGRIAYFPAVGVFVFSYLSNVDNSTTDLTQAAPFTIANTDRLSYVFTTPLKVVGKSSGVTMLNSDRVKSAVVLNGSSTALGAGGWTTVVWSTVAKDIKNEVTTSNTFTPKTTGRYRFSFNWESSSVAWTAADSMFLSINATGARIGHVVPVTRTGIETLVGDLILDLTAGAAYVISAFTSTACTMNANSWCNIEQLTDRDALAGLPLSPVNIISESFTDTTADGSAVAMSAVFATLHSRTLPKGTWVVNASFTTNGLASGDAIACKWTDLTDIANNPTHSAAGAYVNVHAPERIYVANGTTAITFQVANSSATRGNAWGKITYVRIGL